MEKCFKRWHEFVLQWHAFKIINDSYKAWGWEVYEIQHIETWEIFLARYDTLDAIVWGKESYYTKEELDRSIKNIISNIYRVTEAKSEQNEDTAEDSKKSKFVADKLHIKWEDFSHAEEIDGSITVYMKPSFHWWVTSMKCLAFILLH